MADRAGGTPQIIGRLEEIVGPKHVRIGGQIPPEYTHDEALTAGPVVPAALVLPAATAEVAAVLATCNELGVPVVARGSGTGLSGGARPVAGGVVVAFDRMAAILEIDTANQVAVVQPCVTLAQLDEALAPHGLTYPVSPGENGASLGGNAATNAGGMRAVRYGVTRHHVLGLEAVLADGQVLRTGGRYVKSSSGYDLTQLLVGSEGTLALVTEVTLRLHHRPALATTVLAPFAHLAEVGAAIPTITSSGLDPVILEYLDALTMAGITARAGIELGLEQDLVARTEAYLLVVLESDHQDRLDDDVQDLGEALTKLGALDLFVLPAQAGDDLIRAREQAFFAAQAAGADDILDAVVPRASIPSFLAEVAALAAQNEALVTGCGHVGDGNVHISVFQPDPGRRHALVAAVFERAKALGGAVSGEHGIGTEKRSYFLELEDPVRLALLRRIKAAFDPRGILAPGHVLEEPAAKDAP